MLYLALGVAAVLLIATNFTVRSSRPVVYTTVAAAGVSFLPCWMMFLSPVVWELAAVMFFLVVGVVLAKRKWLFHPLSVAAAVVVFGVNAWVAWAEIADARDRHPFESMADRLPERPAASEPGSFDEGEVTALEKLSAEGLYPFNDRGQALRELHENTTDMFLSQPQFGVGRMTGMMMSALRRRDPERPPVPQPGPPALSATEVQQAGSHVGWAEDWRVLHQSSVLDFARRLDLGHVRDRDHVAGFKPHRFTEEPAVKGVWSLRTVDLIGLVVHPEPVAYVSDHLPRMDDIGKIPTRQLFPAEAAALADLRRGADLHARELPNGSVRLVGAIRSRAECVACHGGRRGDLLGAFSYDLRK